ncbi:hypothetical protein HHI36_019775 [Cryptolaemus montrouzieri]|uniref:Uncharacterized protein n=1 Tax=Cryptolaemus montrouzieri TaxID=559131 RepID=A0ABD2N8T8_9CUCU
MGKQIQYDELGYRIKGLMCSGRWVLSAVAHNRSLYGSFFVKDSVGRGHKRHGKYHLHRPHCGGREKIIYGRVGLLPEYQRGEYLNWSYMIINIGFTGFSKGLGSSEVYSNKEVEDESEHIMMSCKRK